MVALFVTQQNSSSVDINISKNDAEYTKSSQSANVYTATNTNQIKSDTEETNSTSSDKETIDELEQLLDELEDIDFGTL